jgi:hypothetical protein
VKVANYKILCIKGELSEMKKAVTRQLFLLEAIEECMESNLSMRRRTSLFYLEELAGHHGLTTYHLENLHIRIRDLIDSLS